MQARLEAELETRAPRPLQGPLKTRRAQRQFSRAASLQLIDQLSRRGGSALALCAGIAIFVAIAPARDTPLRAAVWIAMIFAALFVCRRLLTRFRCGETSAMRPFRWRADYTAALSVLSAAFGAGAFLLTPSGADEIVKAQVLGLILAGAAGAGLAHAAHPATAAAASLPAMTGVALAGLRGFGATEFEFWLLATAALALVVTAAAARAASADALRRFPRSRYVRRSTEISRSLRPEAAGRNDAPRQGRIAEAS